MNDDNGTSTNNESGTTQQTTADTSSQAFKDAVDAAVEVALKDIKEKLNKAYESRDSALAKVKEMETAARTAEIERLKAEGKAVEALEAELANARAELKAAQDTAVQRTRDLELDRTLGALPFRNTRSKSIAFNELISGLVQNAEGAWVDKSGKSLEQLAKDFQDDPDNSMLFKVVQSSGSGSSTSTSAPANTPKPLSQMSQAEVMEKVRKGTLRAKR